MKYVKFDMHCHTAEGSVDSSISVNDYIKKLKMMGFGGMLLTDHDTYGGYDNVDWEKSESLVVLKGIEYDTSDFGHFIVIMPDKADIPVLSVRGLKLSSLIDIVHSNGGILGPAHPGGEPFLSFYSTGIRFGHSEAMKELMPLMDFFEGYNASEDEKSNRISRGLSKRYERPMTGGSDAHKMDCVGLGYAYLPSTIKCNDDLIRYFKQLPRTRTGGRRYGKTLKDKLGIWNKFLVAGFYPYNKYETIKNYRKRRACMNEKN